MKHRPGHKKLALLSSLCKLYITNSSKLYLSNGHIFTNLSSHADYNLCVCTSHVLFCPYTLLVIVPNDIMHIMSAAIISMITVRINLLAIGVSLIVCCSCCLCLHARCLPSGCNVCSRHDNALFPLHMITTATAPATILNTTQNHHTQLSS